MWGFLWVLGALGVSYAGKVSGRGPFVWFVLGAVLTPLGGSLLLWLVNRYNWFRS